MNKELFANNLRKIADSVNDMLSFDPTIQMLSAMADISKSVLEMSKELKE